jgi:hypothetical protein
MALCGVGHRALGRHRILGLTAVFHDQNAGARDRQFWARYR